ncbi:MAG TPA: PspC domain-containing protein, partial [Bacillota bacterium]|nr:PspC domain-containing protein [Bacillota bacterium]
MEPKKLYRSRRNAIISGVCGGIADYLNLDPTVVRVLFVLFTLVTAFFPGVLFYIIS